MPQRSAFVDRPRLSLSQRLAVVAATIVAGLLACSALLAAMGGPVTSALAAPASSPVPYPGGAGCTTTLQACIDSSPAGTTILIQPNTYFTNGLNLNKAVSLTGVSSATVILHAVANQRVLVVTGAAVDSSVIISGLTFAGGHVVGGTCPAGCGGAILITGTAQPLLINLTISNSFAERSGGGLYAATGSPLVMSGVAVVGNFTTIQGAGAFAQDNVTLKGGVFQNNLCNITFCTGGGGLYSNGNLSLTGTQFLSNISNGSGGGALVFGSVTLNGGLFQNNQCIGAGCGGGGGGLLANVGLTAINTQFLSNTSFSYGGGALTYGNVTLDGSSFQNNQCTGASCQGGGLFIYGSLTATNTQFLSNTSKSNGGGAEAGNVTVNGGLFQNNQCTEGSCLGGGLFAPGDLNASNTNFVSNTSTEQGGGAMGTNVTLNGGVFADNRSKFGGGLFGGRNITATNSQFLSNTSQGNGGGAIALNSVTLNGGLFQNNQCTGASCQGAGLVAGTGMGVTSTRFLSNTAQQGGALFHFSGNGRLVNDLFASNTALGGQGEALLLHSPGSVIMLFTTIARPTVGGGSAIYVTSGTVGVTDTLIASYTVGIELAGGSVHEDYNLFSGVAAPLNPAASLGPHSHTSGAANFVDPAAADYHLGLGSAAIDTGVDAGVYFDIDGDPRPLGNGFDIGYDEANIRHLFLPLVLR